MSFGNRLRELRLSRELTQADFANAINLGESTISFYESDKRSPDYETLVKIARFFNVSTDYLLCQTDDPTPHIRVKIATKIDPDPQQEKSSINFTTGEMSKYRRSSFYLTVFI